MSKPRNVIDAVTRLAQMHEASKQQLETLDIAWDRLMKLANDELDQVKIGLDDLASMLGIIEPQSGMPMLPPRPQTGPEPSFTGLTLAGNPVQIDPDLDRYQP
jgi:hypothetical protein